MPYSLKIAVSELWKELDWNTLGKWSNKKTSFSLYLEQHFVWSPPPEVPFKGAKTLFGFVLEHIFEFRLRPIVAANPPWIVIVSSSYYVLVQYMPIKVTNCVHWRVRLISQHMWIFCKLFKSNHEWTYTEFPKFFGEIHCVEMRHTNNFC